MGSVAGVLRGLARDRSGEPLFLARRTDRLRRDAGDTVVARRYGASGIIILLTALVWIMHRANIARLIGGNGKQDRPQQIRNRVRPSLGRDRGGGTRRRDRRAMGVRNLVGKHFDEMIGVARPVCRLKASSKWVREAGSAETRAMMRR